jgi:hypothetical protein
MIVSQAMHPENTPNLNITRDKEVQKSEWIPLSALQSERNVRCPLGQEDDQPVSAPLDAMHAVRALPEFLVLPLAFAAHAATAKKPVYAIGQRASTDAGNLPDRTKLA